VNLEKKRKKKTASRHERAERARKARKGRGRAEIESVSVKGGHGGVPIASGEAREYK